MKTAKRITALILSVLILCTSTFSIPSASAAVAVDIIATVNAGETISISSAALSVLSSTNLLFWGDGDHGFAANIKVYNLLGEVIDQSSICKSDESWLEHYFYGGKTYEVEVLLGKLEVGYNLEKPQWKITKHDKAVKWTAKTSFSDIYLTVGDSIQFGITDVFPGFNAWLKKDQYYNPTTKSYCAFKSDNHGIASVDNDGIITALKAGKTKVTVNYRFGFSESNSIHFKLSCNVTVIDNYGIEDAYSTYFDSTSQKYFNIYGVDPAQKLTDVDITVGNDEYNTGERNDILIDLPDYSFERPPFVNTIDISKDGYHTLNFNKKYLSQYNFITLCKDDGSKNPVIRSVMGYDSSTDVWQNLRVRSMNVKPEGIYCIDADIDWQGHTPDSVWLVQGDYVHPLNEVLNFYSTDTCEIGRKLIADGGPVYLCARTADGITVKVQLMINVYTPVEMIQLDFGDEKDVSAEIEDVDGFDGIPFEIKLGGSAPISFEVDADGKVKGLIGIKLIEGKFSDYAYNLFDGTFYEETTSKKPMDFTKMMEQLRSRDIGAPDWVQKEFAFTCSTMLLGRFEGKMVNGRVHITDVKAAICINGEHKYTQQSIAYYVPYYWTVGLKAGIETQLIAVHENESGELSLKIPDNIFTIEASGALSLGIQGIAGVGAELSALLKFRFPTLSDNPIKESTWTFEVAFYPLMEVLGAELKVDIWDKIIDATIYDGSPDAKHLSAASDSYVMIARSYAASQALLSDKIVSDDGSLITETLLRDIYPESNPQIALCGDKEILVWVGDDAKRTPENRTCLYYSVYDKITDTRSAPVAIHNFGTADFMPKLYNSNGKAHLVWLRAEKEFEAGVTLSQRALALDIFYSEFDVQAMSFTEPVNISNSENIYDFDPVVISLNGELAVVWGSNHSDDIFSGGDNYSISIARLTGSGWVSEILCEALPALNGISASIIEDKLCITYSAHTDGVVGTTDDLELFSFENGSITRLTNNDYIDSAPQYFGDKLFRYENGILTDGESTVKFPTQRTDYIVISNDDNTVTAVLYCVLSKNKHNVYATINNGNGWGEPICITEFENEYITDFSADFDGDELTVITNLRKMNEDGTFGEASLVKSSKKVFCDLEIVDVYYDPFTLVPSGVLLGNVTFVNNGMFTVKNAIVEVTDSEGNLLCAVKAKDGEILPGERVTAEYFVEIRRLNTDELFVSVVTNDHAELNTDNNSVQMPVNMHDVSIENAFITSAPDGKSTITVFVANRGIENVSDIELVFTKDEIGGEILGKVTVNETLYRKNMVMATFEVDTDKISDVVYVEARIAQTENTYTNNRDFVYVDMIKTDIPETQIEVVGDVNRDGKLSEDDVTALRNYLVKNEVEINTAAADVNSDGKLNGKDVVLLGRLVRNM